MILARRDLQDLARRHLQEARLLLRKSYESMEVGRHYLRDLLIWAPRFFGLCSRSSRWYSQASLAPNQLEEENP